MGALVKRSKVRAVVLQKWAESGVMSKWCLGAVVGANGDKFAYRVKAS